MGADEVKSQHIGPRGRTPDLDDDTKKSLLDIRANGDPPAATRASAVLNLAQGKGVMEVSKISGLAQSTVSDLRSRFNRYGMAAVVGGMRLRPRTEQNCLVELSAEDQSTIRQLLLDAGTRERVSNRAKALEAASRSSTLTGAARLCDMSRATLRRAVTGYRSIGLDWVYFGNSAAFSLQLERSGKSKLQHAIEDDTLSPDTRNRARFVLLLADGLNVRRASVSSGIGAIQATEVLETISEQGVLSVLDESFTSFFNSRRKNAGPDKTVAVELADTERRWLKRLVEVGYENLMGSREDEMLIIARAQALLASEEGFSDTKAGSHCGLSKQQVKALRYSYCGDGLETALGLEADSDQVVKRYSGPRTKTPVELSDEERRILARYDGNGAAPHATDSYEMKAARATALLASASGLSDADAGKRAGLSKSQVQRLRNAYNSGGLQQALH